MKYINSYLEKSCSSELQFLYSQSKNPLKEITESMGAYKNMLPSISTKKSNHVYIFIGDGSLCMTTALFAFMTKGQCIGIDPLANVNKINKWSKEFNVNNFVAFKDVFQNVYKTILNTYDKYTYSIVCVHAHVSLTDVHKHFPNWDYLYTNPCCHREKQTFDLKFQRDNNISCVVCGQDENILSDKNEVIIYKNGDVK